MTHPSEDQLFTRFCATGDPEALAAVFDATAGELLRVASHLTGDRALAEDLVQETFVTAIEKAGAFEADRRVVPWLLGILANLARRKQRAVRRSMAAAVDRRTAEIDPERSAE